MGRKGGKKAAERWKNDPNGDYAHSRRQVMAQTHKRNKLIGRSLRIKIEQMIMTTTYRQVRHPAGKRLWKRLAYLGGPSPTT
ncbi:hypothetical protein GCM10028828_20860 [Corynebacterium tapiri]